MAPLLAVPPDHVRASPFVRVVRARGGTFARDMVTGKSYPISAGEHGFIEACASDRPLGELTRAERDLAEYFVRRLILLDQRSWESIAALTMSTLDIEAAGSCNAECIFCPRQELRDGRGLGIMSEETWQRLYQIFIPYLRFAGFVGIGEPTLHKSLPRYIRALKQRGVTTMLVTNGSMLSDELIAALLQAGLDAVKVSFNGHDEGSKASYEDHMLGLDYDETRARVEALLRAAGGRIPVHVSAVETTLNGKALAGFVDYWNARGAKAHVIPCHSRGGHILNIRRRTEPSEADPTPRCGLFNVRCFISWDGRVLACCHDTDAKTTVGDVAVDDAQSIMARKLEVMAAAKWFPVCATCDEPARGLTFEPQQVMAARRA